MGLLLAALLIVLVLGGVGFAVHVLWWVAIAAFVVWLLGFFIRSGEMAGGGRARWYRW